MSPERARLAAHADFEVEEVTAPQLCRTWPTLGAALPLRMMAGRWPC